MLSLSVIEIADKDLEGLVDSMALTLLSAPLIYFWIIQPYVVERDVAEE